MLCDFNPERHDRRSDDAIGLSPCPALYQQALDDFGISKLLEKLSAFSSEEGELTAIAAWLIEQLTANLQANWVVGYLRAMQQEDTEGISELPLLEVPSLRGSALPTDFPMPRFECGASLCWKSLAGMVETDFGTVIGRFYLPAPHRGFQWRWKYLMLLDKDSPSAAIVAADTAWEEDLQPQTSKGGKRRD